MYSTMRTVRPWELWQDEHGTWKQWKRGCEKCELWQRENEDVDALWKEHQVAPKSPPPSGTGTSKWIKVKMEDLNESDWKAFEKTNIEWYPRPGHQVILTREYFSERSVKKHMRIQPRGQN